MARVAGVAVGGMAGVAVRGVRRARVRHMTRVAVRGRVARVAVVRRVLVLRLLRLRRGGGRLGGGRRRRGRRRRGRRFGTRAFRVTVRDVRGDGRPRDGDRVRAAVAGHVADVDLLLADAFVTRRRRAGCYGARRLEARRGRDGDRGRLLLAVLLLEVLVVVRLGGLAGEVVLAVRRGRQRRARAGSRGGRGRLRGDLGEADAGGRREGEADDHSDDGAPAESAESSLHVRIPFVCGALALQPSVAPTRKNLRSASREIEASRGYHRAMYADADLASVGALLAEPARAGVLMALGDGRSLPASMLASEAGVAASTASHHLARLVDGGLLTVVTRGRHRYFTLAGPHVAELLEAVARVAPAQPVRSLREGTRAHTLRYARRCYDHLAGRLGVAVADALFVVRDESFEVTASGATKLASVGISAHMGDTARACVDWTEQRPHVAGALGQALLRRLLELEWLQRDPHTRAVRLTAAGQASLPAE